jgi:flagellar L-ring protein FlgH
MRAAGIALIVLLACVGSEARKGESRQADSLEKYLARVNTAQTTVSYASPGSLWVDAGPMSALAADYKARHVGDVVIVNIVEQVTATNASSVNTQRKFQANSGITAVAGKFNTAGIAALFSPQSSSQLQGQGQAATKTSIRTSVGGRVAATLPNGNLVIEARREAVANNERQTVLLRGVVRPGDVSPDNSVLSTQLSDLELELKGHGVMSDASSPPNWVVRMILKVLGF